VETGVFHPIEAVPGSIEYLNDAEMQAKLIETFSTPTDTSRILCYTNNRVLEYNAFLRGVRGLTPEFVVGDQLVVAQTYARGNVLLSVEREVVIRKIHPTIHDGGYKDVSPGSGPIYYKTMTIQLLSGSMLSLEVKVVSNPDRLKQVMKYLAGKREWKQYFALKSEYIDLRDRDACTVYKSQGSTYETVFIDIGNIGTCRTAQQVARMLFVAVSRASRKVYLYGELMSHYQGEPMSCLSTSKVL
jgi:hypothetical protein